MGSSKIEMKPLKRYIVEEQQFVFSNSMQSNFVPISDITNGVVTKDNVIAINATGVGGIYICGMGGDKSNCVLRYTGNLNGTYKANLIFYYK